MTCCAAPCCARRWALPQDLFKRIASLSYLGDVRMGLAEDSRKVERIVAGSYTHFREAYLPLLQVCASACAPACNIHTQTDRQLLHAVGLVDGVQPCTQVLHVCSARGAHTACSRNAVHFLLLAAGAVLS